jgi:2-dehydropantoate 2-reductase
MVDLLRKPGQGTRQDLRNSDRESGMRIAIVGAGGVGGYLAARLAAAGQDVALIARGAHLDALRAQGLTLKSALGDVSVRPRAVGEDPAAIGPVDLVVFTVKLYDTAMAAEAIRPLVGHKTGVITFQNGVDGPSVLADVLGEEHVIGGTVQIAAVIESPGVIRHTGTMARFILGELDGRRSERVEAFADALRTAGLEHTVSDDVRRDIWQKMIFLSTFSGVTALIRLPIGPIRSDPDTLALMRSCFGEAIAIARAKDVGIGEDQVERALAFLRGLPDQMKSSMLEDLERGRRLELPWLSGAIVRMGRELGLETPAHGFIVTALKLHVDGRA